MNAFLKRPPEIEMKKKIINCKRKVQIVSEQLKSDLYMYVYCIVGDPRVIYIDSLHLWTQNRGLRRWYICCEFEIAVLCPNKSYHQMNIA